MKEYKYGMFSLKELPEDYVGYFGTTGNPGHDLYSLEGYKDVDVRDWCVFFDGDWLYSELLKSPDKLRIVYVYNLTIVGNPHSLDDERGGSKTLLICGGHRDAEYMANMIEKYDWVKDIFHKVANRFCVSSDEKQN